MRAALLASFGSPDGAISLAELPMPVPGPGDVLVQMIAAPVNPADLNVIAGTYGELPALPAVIGNEGAGRVVESRNPGVNIGDLVLPRRVGTWAEFVVTGDVIVLPPEIDPFQASMLSVNPPSALGMLAMGGDLVAGDWVVQNAANSGVGRCVIQLARTRGLRTLNVVRRAELIPELRELGADIVVTEENDLRAEVDNLCGGCRPRLALNAVGGASALNVANALANGGRHVTYGAMGRQPLKIPNGLLIFRGLRFEGFWLRPWLVSRSSAEAQSLVAELADAVISGNLRQPIDEVIPLVELPRALAAAAREKRGGKVLIGF